MHIIIGLGNPGEKYRHTRHNAGWIFLDNLFPEAVWRESSKFNALIHEVDGFIVAKPLTFMNNSGACVRKLLDYYGLLTKNLGLFAKKDQDLNQVLTIIQDELDLNFGEIKISSNSGSAGHRGIDSIISHLKTKNFKRLRIGVKNELLRTRIPADKFVLQNFSQEELAQLKKNASTYKLSDLVN